MRRVGILFLVLCGAAMVFTGATCEAQASATTEAGLPGVLLMAHGGGKEWNAQVAAVAAEVDKQVPTEVALGMADRATLEAAIARLTARGATRIIAVPLFVSSHSSVIESTKYLLGLRPDAPKDLAYFARMGDMPGMNHAGAGMGAHAGSGASTPPAAETRTAGASSAGVSGEAEPAMPAPLKLSVPVVMTPALDSHPLVAAILADRAAAIAGDAKRDVVILVAHGPNEDAENAEWLADMNALGRQIAARAPYARIEALTVRDDADAPVRDKAAAELRAKAQQADDAGYRALIVPVLLSYGGIESGVRQRLDGVDHTFSPQALLPDPRISQWVVASAEAASGAVMTAGK